MRLTDYVIGFCVVLFALGVLALPGVIARYAYGLEAEVAFGMAVGMWLVLLTVSFLTWVAAMLVADARSPK